MNLTALIQHPEQMDKETLYDLRSLLALHPYYQSARLLMLQNLYILHDPSFDEELRRAAIYITDRKVIFNLVEAAHYKPKTPKADAPAKPGEDRTAALIDNFLDSIPTEDDEEKDKKKRKPTPADAAVDYVAYLLETENEDEAHGEDKAPQMKGQDLIDNFINKEGGNFTLQDEPEYTPEIDEENNAASHQPAYYTETLAKIYIKQGQYSKALEIIRHLNLNNSKKSVYFADQIRFLDKLILNNKSKK